MRKKEMLAMLLAGGQGSRLGVLTTDKAKPGVAFGGKYRIIDFPLSNCINSGVDTVGVLTQYQPLTLNQHIGIGTPWDLDGLSGGVTILAPHQKTGESGDWYSGTANAIYQNISYIDHYNPEYVLILSGDHIYKMDYSDMLSFHKKNNCDVTIAVMEVPWEEASRFGIMNADENDKIYEFEEKPANPKSNLASMGIYIFTWSKLREALIADNKVHADSDFGMHILPAFLNSGQTLYAWRFKDYWKDVGTIDSYWRANMELIDTVPEFNLYEKFWRIYTKNDHQPPQFTSATGEVSRSLISEGCQIYGKVQNSVISKDVTIEEGAEVYDSIIMENCTVKAGTKIYKSIIDQNSVIDKNVTMGVGEDIANEDKPNIYNTGITVVGNDSYIPEGVTIGKNCVVYGVTKAEDYAGGELASGKSCILKEGEL
ncbi:MAG: glucose-1-phosphate adenylyltransferase [Clostridiales bacterium]|nr:glucose-1-phosphate adenylyltransferase [Clostridiales bacterium]